LTKRTLYAKNSAAIVTHSGRHVKNIQYRHLLQTKKLEKFPWKPLKHFWILHEYN